MNLGLPKRWEVPFKKTRPPPEKDERSPQWTRDLPKTGRDSPPRDGRRFRATAWAPGSAHLGGAGTLPSSGISEESESATRILEKTTGISRAKSLDPEPCLRIL